MRIQEELKSLVSKGNRKPRAPGIQRPVPVCQESLNSVVTRLGRQRVKIKTAASECSSIWRLRRPHGRSRYRVRAIPRSVLQRDHYLVHVTISATIIPADFHVCGSAWIASPSDSKALFSSCFKNLVWHQGLSCE